MKRHRCFQCPKSERGLEGLSGGEESAENPLHVHHVAHKAGAHNVPGVGSQATRLETNSNWSSFLSGSGISFRRVKQTSQIITIIKIRGC